MTLARTARTPHRALLLGALGHTAVATCLALVFHTLPGAFDDAAGVAVLLASVVMGLLLSVTVLVVARGASVVPLGKAVAVSVAMFVGGSLLAVVTTVLLYRFGLERLFNPHIPLLELLTMVLLAVGGAAFLVGDYLAGLAACRLLVDR